MQNASFRAMGTDVSVVGPEHPAFESAPGHAHWRATC